MTSHCLSLFRYAASRVAIEDIRAFAPDDPGYAAYVAEWTPIRTTNAFPAEMTFEVSETIDLTQHVTADRLTDSSRFRRFRVFTNSVAIAMAASGITHATFAANYVVANLIDDARNLEDATLNQLLLDAVDELFETCGRATSKNACLCFSVARSFASSRNSQRTRSPH